MPTLKASCPKDVKECWSASRCWNWLKSHTYRTFDEMKQEWPIPSQVWFVSSIKGFLNGGVSELKDYIDIKLEVQEYPSKAWKKIATYDVMADPGTKTPFTAEINKKIMGVRFVAGEGNKYVDQSEWTITGIPLGIVKLILDSIGVETKSKGYLPFNRLKAIEAGDDFSIKAVFKNVGDPGEYQIRFGDKLLSTGNVGANETITIRWPETGYNKMSTTVSFKERFKVLSRDHKADRYITRTYDVGLPLSITRRIVIDGAGILKTPVLRTWNVLIPAGIPTTVSITVKNVGSVTTTGRLLINKAPYSLSLGPGVKKTITHDLSPQYDRSLLVDVKLYSYDQGKYKLTDSIMKSLLIKPTLIKIRVKKDNFFRPVDMFKLPVQIDLLDKDEYMKWGNYPKVRVNVRLAGTNTYHLEFSSTTHSFSIAHEDNFIFAEGLTGAVTVFDDAGKKLARSNVNIHPFEACFLINQITPGLFRKCNSKIMIYAGDEDISQRSVGFTKRVFTNTDRGGMDKTTMVNTKSLSIYKPQRVDGVVKPFSNLGYLFDEAVAFGISFSKPLMVVFPESGHYFKADKVKWIAGKIRHQDSTAEEEEEIDEGT